MATTRDGLVHGLFVGLGVAAIVVAALAALQLPPNLCHEGSELPQYTTVDLGTALAGEFPPYYRLLEVADVSALRQPAKLPRAAVLFVPGNAGAFTQVKSLAAEASKAGLPLRFFTADLAGELVAFRGQLLQRQSLFVRRCLALLRLQATAPDAAGPADATPVLAVGHSMGGLVLRAALGAELGSAQPVPLLLTLGTPHAAPVVATEAPVAAFFAQLNADSSLLRDIALVSVGGGERDIQVPIHLTELPALALQMHMAAQAIRGVQGSVDHQCLSWCLPMIHRVNELLLASADTSRGSNLFSHMAETGTLWSTTSKIAWPRVLIQPGRVSSGSDDVNVLCANNTANATRQVSGAGCWLQLRKQWLSFPQRLTLRCSAATSTPKLYLVDGRGPPSRLPLLSEPIMNREFAYTILASAYSGNYVRTSSQSGDEHDIDILIETTDVNSVCVVSMSAEVARAAGQFGHQKPGVLFCGTIALLVLLEMDLALGSAMLGTVFVVVVAMIRCQIPLHDMMPIDGLGCLIMVGAQTCAAVATAALMISAAGMVRQAVRTLPLPAARLDVTCQRWTHLLIFVLHPFEALWLCWIQTLNVGSPFQQQSGKLVGADHVACRDALMMFMFILKLPGSVAKWNSRLGCFGPLQISPFTSPDAWWLLAASMVDTAAAIALGGSLLAPIDKDAHAVLHCPRGRFATALAALCVGLCGREMYAVPWVLALAGVSAGSPNNHVLFGRGGMLKRRRHDRMS